MEKEHQIQQNQAELENKPQKPEVKEEFKMPEIDTEDYKIIQQNANNEQRELGKDIFYKLNPIFAGKGHVTAKIEKNVLFIETFKPETQLKREQGGFDQREKELAQIELNLDPSDPEDLNRIRNVEEFHRNDILNAQNEKYVDYMESTINKLNNEKKQNPSSHNELRLSQMKRQLESYGNQILAYSSSVDNPKMIELGTKSLLLSNSPDRLAMFYYHYAKENQKEMVDKYIKDNYDVSHLHEYLSDRQNEINTEILDTDTKILKKPKENISGADIKKLIIDSGNFISHCTNHAKEILRDGYLLSAYAYNERNNIDVSSYRSQNTPEKGINFNDNNLYQGESFFQYYDTNQSREQNVKLNTAKYKTQPIAFITHQALINTTMREANSEEQYGGAKAVFIGDTQNGYKDKSHELDIGLGLFFLPEDLNVDAQTGLLNKGKKENRVNSKEYWDNYFTSLVKEGKEIPNMDKIIFYKGNLNRAVNKYFLDKGMPSSPIINEKLNNELIKKAGVIRINKKEN